MLTLWSVAGADFTPGYLNMVDRRVATMPYYVSSNVGNNAGALQALARVLVLDMDFCTYGIIWRS